MLIEVELVEAHRNEKEGQQMSRFENLITEGNQKADELAKGERCWMEVLQYTRV